MKALLIAEDATNLQSVLAFLRLHGFDIIHYRSALKALDNIEEIEPDAILISAVDFPRHWKVLTQYAKTMNKNQAYRVFLFDEPSRHLLDYEEALNMGVRAVIDIDPAIDGEHSTQRLNMLFSRSYPTIALEGSCAQAGLSFFHPHLGTIVTGTVQSISEQEIVFEPNDECQSFETGFFIDDVTLKLDSLIISIQAEITAIVNNCLILTIHDLSHESQALIRQFM